MKQQDYPSNGLDWEARGMGEFSPSPNVRKLPADYPVNEQDSEISPLMFNAVGGSTILWAAHFPRLTPGDFRDEERGRRRRGLADRLRDARTLLRAQRPHDGCLGARGRPGVPVSRAAVAAAAARQAREHAGLRLREARLALVALRQRHPLAGVRGARAVHQPRPVPDRLRARREGQHRHHLLAGGPAEGRAVAHRLPRAGDHGAAGRHGGRRPLLRRGRPAAGAEGGDRGAGVQRHRHAAAAAQLEEQRNTPMGWPTAAASWART